MAEGTLSCRPRRSGGYWHWGALAALLLCVLGCGQRAEIHPALRATEEDLDRAASIAKELVAKGQNPLDALTYRSADSNTRVSSDVILRSAGLTLPIDRIVYEIARLGDTSDVNIRRGIEAGLRGSENEVICVASIQVAESRDPASIQFALRASVTEYPPLSVDTPVLLREISAAYDPSAGTAKLYLYVIHFPIKGGPGYPPIGPTITSLTFVVKDAGSEATASFQLPAVPS